MLTETRPASENLAAPIQSVQPSAAMSNVTWSDVERSRSGSMEYVPGCRSVKGWASPAKMSRIVGVRSWTVGVWDGSTVGAGEEATVAPVISGPEAQAASASTTVNARARP